MNTLWTAMAAIGGPVAAALGSWYAARATRTAAGVTADAHRHAAEVTAGPEERLADLAVFKAAVERVDAENAQLRQRLLTLETLVRAFARHVARLTGQLRDQGIEPCPPPDRVEEYNRTGA
ncbi:hypothetical protein [Streptomyces marincola]|uniref:Uncharacterized protein n=1 Tax=Streptomyces marincola TaxID=2878388 RepID=A0A1W7D0V8_9ACTN|nr:hypothetical protein [Streptomyces marincola]ARQ70210.1 hypothetical protein CAG99_16375 [Streptomyces marincola]